MTKLKAKEVRKRLTDGNPKQKPGESLRSMVPNAKAAYEMLRKLKALKKHEEK